MKINKNKDIFKIYEKCKTKILSISKDKKKSERERISLMLFYKELLFDLEYIMNHNLDCSIEELSYYAEHLD